MHAAIKHRHFGLKALSFALGMAGLVGASQAAQYQVAPTSHSGVDGVVAGWMSNLPEGTLEQDWYPGSGVDSFCDSIEPCSPPVQTHDPVFLTETGAQRVGAGLSIAPHMEDMDFQVLSGLTTNNLDDAMDAGQFIEFPFIAGSLEYANGQAAPNFFYVDGIFLSARWNLHDDIPNAFGYGAYVVDAIGNPVSELISQSNDVRDISTSGFHPIRVPTALGSGIALLPGAAYALRFYIYRADTSDQAVWDDTLFTMSRQMLADLQVTASPVSTTVSPTATSYSYSFNVYNNGPDASTATIADPLPSTANAATATWTCVLQPSELPCPTASGSGPITQEQTFGSGDTAVYTVSWTGPQVTAPSSHSIFATPLETAPEDPNMANNFDVVRLGAIPITPQPVPGLGLLALLGLSASMVGLGSRRFKRLR